MARWKLAAIIGAGLVALCCVGGVIVAATSDSGKAGYNAAMGATTPAAAPTTANPAAPTQAAAPVTKDRQLCQVSDNGGSYYLLVTSATEHDFRACAGAQPYAGTLDDLLALPGVDRRCILPNESIGFFHALVGVYSGSKTADLAAAKQFCKDNKGTNS